MVNNFTPDFFHLTILDELIKCLEKEPEGTTYKRLFLHVQEIRKDKFGESTPMPSFSRKMKGSRNRIKARLRVEKWHTKILNARNDFLHKISAQLVSECKIITFEKLDIKGLIPLQRNALNICDASWGKLVQLTSYKAENAGCEVRTINPKQTSMTCHICGNIQKMPLTQRRFNCVKCGLRIDRDLNSAKQIKLKGKELAYAKRMLDFSNGKAILNEV